MDWSKLWSVNTKDWTKGLIIAVISTPLTIIMESLNAGSLTLDWKKVGIVALTAGIAYLVKNFATGSSGRMLTEKPSDPIIPTPKIDGP